MTIETENKKLRAAINDLVNLYVANRGTPHEFISCITAGNASDLSKTARAKNKTWRAWDRARKLLENK